MRSRLFVLCLGVASFLRAELPLPALLDRFEQTGEARYLVQCRTALASGPETRERSLVRARLLLLSGDFAQSLDLAMRLNREQPDNLDTYAAIVDAARALGKLAEAERATQWMLDLRPEDVRGVLRAAELRTDFGDLPGASDLFAESYHRAATNPYLKTRALLGLAEIAARSGKPAEMRRYAQEVLKSVPGDKRALAMLEEEQ